jgi:hypothetical protein
MERGKPHILNFQLMNSQVDEGGWAIVRWDVRGADSLEVSGILDIYRRPITVDLTKNRGICVSGACDDVIISEVGREGEALVGNLKIKMRASSSLTMKAESSKGADTQTLDINVNPMPPPPPKPPRKHYEGEEKI